MLMYPHRFLAILGVLMCSCSFAYGQAATQPVGFLSVTIPGTTNAASPSGTVVSVPLDTKPVAAAAITSVDSTSSFSSATATWTAGAYVATPYLVRITSGANTGRSFLIVTNSTTQLTVDPKGYDLTQLLSVNDTFEILPANTLGSLFGTSAPLLTPGASANVADNVVLWDGSAWSTYYHNGTNWRKSGSFANQNNTIVYPDEGLFIFRRATLAVTLTFVGRVPITTERTDLAGGVMSFVANRFPVDMTLGAIGLQNTTNWVSGASANAADNVFLWNGSTWDTYYFNGTNWQKSGSFAIQDATVIPVGTALFVLRTQSGATLAQTLPYAL